MNLFGVPEAEHYCDAFNAALGAPSGSLKDFVAVDLRTASTLTEGTAPFNAYRDCALRDADRCLFLAVSHYRRCADLMVASAAHWAHVTLYYGTYFAANALLGMFGGWVNNRLVIDVVTSAPGQQELRIARKVKIPNGGSHRLFWDLFYSATPPLYAWVEPSLVFAIQPISGNVMWQTETRNLLNYDTFAACQLTGHFQAGFRRSKFPGTLPGAINTQFRVLEALLRITCGFAQQFALTTDALNGMAPAGTRRAKIRHLVFNAGLPDLARRLRRRGVLV